LNLVRGNERAPILWNWVRNMEISDFFERQNLIIVKNLLWMVTNKHMAARRVPRVPRACADLDGLGPDHGIVGLDVLVRLEEAASAPGRV